MFGGLKDKLKNALGKFSKKVEEEGIEREVEVEVTEEPKKKKVKVKKEKKKETKEKKVEKKVEEEFVEEKKKELIEEEILEETVEEPKEKKEGFFQKFKKSVTTKKINGNQFDEFFYELELAMLENNVAVEVIEKIKESLKMDLVDVAIDKKEIDKIVGKSLKKSLEEIFDVEKIDLFKKIEEKDGVFLVVFVGVNGSGKTTTIAKIASMLKEKKISCVLAAADTFRAAAIHQLGEHGEKLGIKVIKHDYGSDPAAVIFDAVKHAKAKGIKVVLADTAGRQQSNVNLVEEMKKITRVNNPDLKIFVGESITGNDATTQARSFNEAIGIDAIILTKTDVDDKGGAIVSVGFVTGKPIIYLGCGQSYLDLKEFDPKEVIDKLLG
ncbi:MAG: signal recognition particle-docking protein FtsY [Nanoarchaeota archaeon]|nr:signal recognition particle-docking protein FtsY [Nanoarchaeota archaeon]MBU1445445.1 signal recognition particle-docking protein FtsY [Nanoarchaeota archaeon]MBU2420253.1 signal recognition particle-docking protein FtsY [Nanoarchaeota archaeon]MBU2474984.1 signal recognition particle-docking protein FtsY [Nanoarchaeota archaeon]